MSFLFLLVGCDNTNFEIKAIEKLEYEETEIDSCNLILEIEGLKVLDHHRSKQKISIRDYNITCPIKNVRKLGKQEVEIKINGISKTIQFEVVDTTAPELISDDQYEVEAENPYFDIKELIKAIDLYDSNPDVFYTGDYDLEVPGTYQIEVVAIDSSKNESSKNFSIIVKEKEVVVEEQIIYQQVPVENNSNTGGNSSGGSSGGSGNGGGGSTPQQHTPSTLPSKSFTVEEGYDMQTAFSACKSYRGANSGSCSPFNKANGLFGGYIYTP